MKKWEYKLLRLSAPSEDLRREFSELLNSHGNEGWRVLPETFTFPSASIAEAMLEREIPESGKTHALDELIVAMRQRLSPRGPVVDDSALHMFVAGDERLDPMLRVSVARAILRWEDWFQRFIEMLVQSQEKVDQDGS